MLIRARVEFDVLFGGCEEAEIAIPCNARMKIRNNSYAAVFFCVCVYRVFKYSGICWNLKLLEDSVRKGNIEKSTDGELISRFHNFSFSLARHSVQMNHDRRLVTFYLKTCRVPFSHLPIC